jgi:hypothetical protein
MPLNTQIKRGGKVLRLKWGNFHVAAMVIAASADSGVGPYEDMKSFVEEAKSLMEKQGTIGISPYSVFQLTDYAMIGATPLNAEPYVLKERWKFTDTTDGEVLELLPGDELSARRVHKS